MQILFSVLNVTKACCVTLKGKCLGSVFFNLMCPPVLVVSMKDSKVLSLAWDSLVGKDPEEVKQQKQQKLKGEIKEVLAF